MSWWNRSLSWAARREGAAPGWEALDRALENARAGEAMHFPTGHKPGRAGAYAINAYRVEDLREGPLWLLVTWGLSDLFEPSGTPVHAELTMRVPRREHTEEPPQWARLLLDAMAQRARQGASAPAPGTVMELGGPIDGSRKTAQVALMADEDPVLGEAHSVLGRVSFVSLLGIDAETVGGAKAAGAELMHARLRAENPLWVTRLTRR